MLSVSVPGFCEKVSLVNPSFEENTGWRSNRPIIYSTEEAHSGSRSAKIIRPDNMQHFGYNMAGL